MSLQESAEKTRIDSKLLVLHFVGPSGTGKSFLAQIVAKSFFRPENCNSLGQYVGSNYPWLTTGASGLGTALYIGTMSNPLTAVVAAVGGAAFGFAGTIGIEAGLNRYSCSEVDSWLQTCGIIYVSFSEASDEYNAEKLMQTLDDLAEELKHDKNPVLILDDFNFCKGVCQNALKQLLTQQTLKSSTSSEMVSARNVIVLITSDLTNFGVQLRKGENYDEALDKVEDAAKRYWGSSSFVVTSSQIIPFAPLSEAEIVKVVDMMLAQFEKSLKIQVDFVLDSLKTQSDDDSDMQWTGKLICTESTKQNILDHMHAAIEIKNSRAIVEELSTMLRQIINYPESLQDRLQKLSSKVMYKEKQRNVFGFSLPFKADILEKSQKTIVYDQDIILEFDISKKSGKFVKLIIQDDD